MMAEKKENQEKSEGRNALLVSGGTADRSFVTDFMTNRRYDLILAVDGGLKLCHDAGILPTHLVGDFDTVETLDEYQKSPQHIEFGEFVYSVRVDRACIDYEI